MRKLIINSVLGMSLLASPLAFAEEADGFMVKHVDVEGLQRISKGTVYSYLPFKVGQQLSLEETNDVISSLYATGFFSDISLSRDKDTLVISVVERPTISHIEISGNSEVKTEDLEKVLKQLGIAEGLTFNPSAVDRVEVGLQEQYYAMGYYGADVSTTIDEKNRNRVAVNIVITEGRPAIVRGINLIGNKAVSDKRLRKNFNLNTPTWLSWMMDNDLYSKEKLAGDEQSLVSYYMDHGYLEFKINSSAVQVTPDKSNVYLNIDLNEGPQYTISGVSVEGDTVISNKEFRKNIDLKKGQVFSRKELLSAEQVIKEMLGRKGYALATVKVTPEIDKDKHTVFITLLVDQGNLVYVRHVNFIGNSKVDDVALRTKMAQLEGGIINTDLLKQSKRQLSQLVYVRNVQINQSPVADSDDRMDLDVKMEEVPSAEISAGIGYSEVDGFLIDGHFVQNNVLGTGKRFSIDLVRSSYQQNYSMSYENPYYTISGISRGIKAYLIDYDPSAANISSDYSYNDFGGEMYYNIPLSATIGANNSMSVGYGLSRTTLDIYDGASDQVNNFVDDYGTDFNQVLLQGSWKHNGLDRAVFPTKGFMDSIGAHVYLPMDDSSLGYFTSTYKASFYQPLSTKWIFQARGELGYGAGMIRTDELPFYRNFYAGGMYTVRGFEGNTIGPLDSNGDPFGGNLLMDGSLAIIFPSFVNPDNVRTSWFIDGGSVYDTEGATDYSGFSTGDLRFGTGFDLQWFSPIGVLEFSLAEPISKKDTDKKQFFSFNIGARF